MEAWLDRLRREIEEATSGLTEADWRRAPRGQWNSAQILDHLGRSYTGTARMLEKSLRENASAEPSLRTATLKERVFQLLVVTMGKFPKGRNAPQFLAPQDDSGPEVLPKVLRELERMREALAAAEQRWGSKPVMAHFAIGPMSVAQWRKFHYVHGRHHLQHIRERSAGGAAVQKAA